MYYGLWTSYLGHNSDKIEGMLIVGGQKSMKTMVPAPIIERVHPAFLKEICDSDFFIPLCSCSSRCLPWAKVLFSPSARNMIITAIADGNIATDIYAFDLQVESLYCAFQGSWKGRRLTT